MIPDLSSLADEADRKPRASGDDPVMISARHVSSA